MKKLNETIINGQACFYGYTRNEWSGLTALFGTDQYLPVTDVMETLAEPEMGSALSSAMHSTLLEHVDGVDFILKEVSELNSDSNTLTSVAIQ